MAKRRQKLEDSLKWHQFNFDADGELQWIKDHRSLAASTDYGKNLSDAQNLVAKQKVRGNEGITWTVLVVETFINGASRTCVGADCGSNPTEPPEYVIEQSCLICLLR